MLINKHTHTTCICMYMYTKYMYTTYNDGIIALAVRR